MYNSLQALTRFEPFTKRVITELRLTLEIYNEVSGVIYPLRHEPIYEPFSQFIACINLHSYSIVMNGDFLPFYSKIYLRRSIYTNIFTSKFCMCKKKQACILHTTRIFKLLIRFLNV